MALAYDRYSSNIVPLQDSAGYHLTALLNIAFFLTLFSTNFFILTKSSETNHTFVIDLATTLNILD